MPRFKYEHGLPFSRGLAVNIEDLVKRIDNKKASLIIIEGGVGEGKTTLGVHIADYTNSLKKLPPIDFSGPQLAMGGVDFLKKMRVCYEEKLPVIIYDEAGDFSKRGALTRFNAVINRTFETFRAFKCLVIICLPNFNVLDNQLFDNKIPRLLLNCRDRTNAQGNYDGYGLSEMLWLKYWIKKSPIKNYAYGRVYANFNGHFLDLDPERSKLLDKVSISNKLNILRKNEVRIEGLLSYPEIAQRLNVSIDFVRRAVSNLKIKPARCIGRAKYFDQEALAQLSDFSETVAEEPRGRPRKPQEAV